MTKNFCIFALLLCSIPKSCAQNLACDENDFSFRYTKQTQILLGKLKWLPRGADIEKAQNRVFQEAQEKSGGMVVTPRPPADALMNWQYYRYYPQGDDTDIAAPIDHKELYVLVAEDLLLAQKLLAQKDLRQQRRGLQLMFRTTLNTDMRLKDEKLTAKIYDAFMLPFLQAANADPVDGLSRTAILQNACGIYKKANDIDKFEASLRVLVSLANAAHAPQIRDWSRYTLAIFYADQNKFGEAIDVMQSVSTPGLL